MDILRFITAGSVDDGKSTLTGRLLYDTNSVLSDQLEVLKSQSKNKSKEAIDLAILTDGLRAEREQGITIDVAYKYFSTQKRKFISIDAPGHKEFTRNMVTGASNADLIIILIDARYGVVEQTRRHSMVASLLGIQHVIVAINKMDLVNYDQNEYEKIVSDYQKITSQLDLNEVIFIPISALEGENVTGSSQKMNWYTGETLLSLLENVKVDRDVDLIHARFPIQYVISADNGAPLDYIGYAGKITSGVFKKGDKVTVLPSGQESKIKSITRDLSETREAFATQSVIIQLEDLLGAERGDMIVHFDNIPEQKKELEILVCWMGSKEMKAGSKYFIQHQSRQVRCGIKEIAYKLNIDTLEKEENADAVHLNDICKVTIKTSQPLFVDSYKSLRTNGSAILIDEESNVTVAACIFLLKH